MPKNNGGLIGRPNLPSQSLSSGIWSSTDIFIGKKVVGNLGIPTNGLQLFLDASNLASYPGSGSTWYDISGNSRNFSWASSPSFNSSGISYFSTLGNNCIGPASNSFGITNNSGYTIFLSFYQNVSTSAGAFKFVGSGSVNLASRGIFSHATWGDNIIYFDQGGCCDANQRVNTTPITNPLNTWHFAGFRNNYGVERSIWLNGSKLAQNTAASADINLSSGAVNVGSASDEYGGNSSIWNARISMFIVYNRSLSDEEMSTVNNALKSKIGL